MHVHVTDHLLGRSPADAADVLDAVSARCEMSLTLHDVPQGSDGPGRLERRSEGYRRMARAARRVVVSSEHERALLHEHVGADVAARAHVVPLGASRGPGTPSAPAASVVPRHVLIAGWVYPGKGHLEAARAAACAADGLGEDDVRVVAVGGPSPGHEGELDALRRTVHEMGIELEVTGVLSPEEYRAQLSRGGAPVVAHQHVSASRTLLEWAENGRRAIVLRSRYSEEVDALRPGLVDVVDPDELGSAIRAAWQDPGSTRLPPTADLRPYLEDAARAYLDVWRTA